MYKVGKKCLLEYQKIHLLLTDLLLDLSGCDAVRFNNSEIVALFCPGSDLAQLVNLSKSLVLGFRTFFQQLPFQQKSLRKRFTASLDQQNDRRTLSTLTY
jgi:hypothetical protein